MIILDATLPITNAYFPDEVQQIKKAVEWVSASDAYTTAIIKRYHNHNETTAIAYRAAKERFELVDRELNELTEGDSEVIRNLMIKVWSNDSVPKSRTKKRSR